MNPLTQPVTPKTTIRIVSLLLLSAVVLGAAWFGWRKYQSRTLTVTETRHAARRRCLPRRARQRGERLAVRAHRRGLLLAAGGFRGRAREGSAPARYGTPAGHHGSGVQGGRESKNVTQNYRLLIAKSDRGNKADQARFRLGRHLEDEGDFAGALQVLREVKATNNAGLQRRIASLQQQLAMQPK